MVVKFANKSMTVLPFFLLNGELSSTNTDLATPTAERSGLAWASILPSLLHTSPSQASDHDRRECLSSFLYSNYSPSALCICKSMSNSVI